MPQLSSEQAQYVTRYWRLSREANEKATRFRLEWEAANKSFKQWCSEMGITDPVQVTKIQSENLTMRDAMAAYTWWRDEAQRCMAVIQSEFFGTMMIRGGATWDPPTP